MKTEERLRREITREVELRTMAKCWVSGCGPASDICEELWMTLAEFGYEPDGNTSLRALVRSILEENKSLREAARL